jgi:hypothetical protein
MRDWSMVGEGNITVGRELSHSLVLGALREVFRVCGVSW